MHDLDGYLTTQAIRADEAELSGDYMFWPTIDLELEPWQWMALKMLAKSKGVALEDLVVAIAEQRATRVLSGLTGPG